MHSTIFRSEAEQKLQDYCNCRRGFGAIGSAQLVYEEYEHVDHGDRACMSIPGSVTWLTRAATGLIAHSTVRISADLHFLDMLNRLVVACRICMGERCLSEVSRSERGQKVGEKARNQPGPPRICPRGSRQAGHQLAFNFAVRVRSVAGI